MMMTPSRIARRGNLMSQVTWTRRFIQRNRRHGLLKSSYATISHRPVHGISMNDKTNPKSFKRCSILSYPVQKRMNDNSVHMRRFISSASTSDIERLIDNNKVVVFSKTFCPFCVATKNLFEGLKVDIEVVELDLLGEEGAALQDLLFEMTSQRSVPNVFVAGKHIGGNDDTQEAARNGTLDELLKES